MKKNDFKDSGFNLVAAIAKAMGNGHRLEILELLANGSKSVQQISVAARINLSNASQHLKILKQHKLVKINRKGITVYHELADRSILSLIKVLHQTAYRQLPEMRLILSDFRKQFGTDQAVTKSIPDDDYILLDVRSSAEYGYGHHQGAISIPFYNLDKSFAKLDKSKLIIAYCRGELCAQADEVVQKLIAEGFRAVRLEEIVMMKSA